MKKILVSICTCTVVMCMISPFFSFADQQSEQVTVENQGTIESKQAIEKQQTHENRQAVEKQGNIENKHDVENQGTTENKQAAEKQQTVENKQTIEIQETLVSEDVKKCSMADPQVIEGKNTFSVIVGNIVKLNQKAKTKLSYLSSDNNIASVDNKGNVKAKKAGTAVITVRAEESELYRSAEKKIKITSDYKTYSKITVIGTLSADNMVKMATVKSGNSVSHIPQSMAYRGNNCFSVCFNNEKCNRQVIRNYSGNKCKKSVIRNDNSHCNGMAYCEKKNSLYIVDSHGSSRKKAVALNASTLKKTGSMEVIKKAGAIGYDRKTGGFYMGINGRFFVKDLNKYFSKKPKYTWQQDICGNDKFIYSCVSVDKAKNNRIDIYGINGKYYGSYKVKLSGITELESVDIDEAGKMMLLINIRCVARSKSIDKIYRSKKALAY